MSIRSHNVLDGMEELLLSLARKHSTPQQWGSWLKIILQGAAMEGDAEAVSALLNAGAYPSGRSKDGLTPLHAAAQGGSLGVVVSLLKTSAIRNVNKKTKGSGQTPSHIAATHGYTDVARALVRAGGDVNLTDACGRSPLICAASDGKAELVNDLLLRGSRVDAKDNNGDQALDIAVRLGHLGVIKALLQAGACPGARGKDNKSPVDLAVEHGDTDTLLELLGAGPNLGILDDRGDSALCIAVRYEHLEAIDVLLDAGAGPNSDSHAKTTYTHAACFHLRPGSVEALLRRDANEYIHDNEFELPYAIVGHGIPEEERYNGVVRDICKMLVRAPADRVWRRRGWLAMLNARKRGADKEHRRKDHEAEAEDNQHDKAESASALSSGRMLADGGKWAPDNGAHVHPSRKRLHWIVTKMVDVADELVFQNIVSYL